MTEPMGNIRRNSFAEAAKVSRETGEPVVVCNENSEYIILSAEREREIALRELEAALDNAEEYRKNGQLIPAEKVRERLKKKYEAL